MKYNKLGKTDISVSSICLGTMTWGEQNSEKDAYQQMDYALDSGINFFDTAELYAIPPRPETAGLTEEYIGNWFKKRGKRDKVVLATKVAGRSEMTWLRNEEKETRLNKKQIHYALENSLKRLKTDYIDVYQLHKDPSFKQMPIVMDTMKELQKQGKIRFIGSSTNNVQVIQQLLNLGDLSVIQVGYNLINRGGESTLKFFRLNFLNERKSSKIKYYTITDHLK